MIVATIKAQKSTLLVVASSIIIVADRVAWACVSQWREDQALSMWLGLHFFRQATPVGLLNSIGIPNPNGIALVALALSALPSLLTVSVVLGCICTASAFLAAAQDRKTLGRAWPALLVLGSSVHIRGLGAELWGQWLMISINLLFVATAVAYLRRPRVAYWAVVFVLIVAAPSIYLAGIVNAAAFVVVWTLVVIYQRHRNPQSGPAVLPLILVLGIVASLSALITWIPYFRSVSLSRLVAQVGLPWSDRLREAGLSLVLAPGVLGDLLHTAFAPLLQSDPIVRPAAFWLIQTADFAALLQVVVAAAAVVALLRRAPATRAILEGCGIAGLFILLAFPLSPLLGGFSWHRGERLDQSIQFLPLLLLVIFAVPAAVESRILRRATVTLAFVFGITSLAAGWMVVEDHLDYRGALLSQADVPLTEKIDVVDWIASDWRGRGQSASVPVAYELIGIWRFLPEYGRLTSRWYPGELSIGRAFDYMLLRRYGLANAFEGRIDRPNQRARYVVSYAFMPRPSYVGAGAAEHVFGRLRVSVREGQP